MTDPETYIQDGLHIIDQLIEQGNLQAAFNACQELLRVNPYHSGVQKYLKNIQQLILEDNEKKVNADIEATMHLWKEEKYDELMKIYARLYQYAPYHKRLKKLIETLAKKQQEKQEKEREQFVGEALGAIDKLIRDGQHGDAIQASNELLALDPLNKKAHDYLQKAKDGLIDKMLKENARVIDSADFERTLQFYQSLLAIDPGNSRVNQLAAQTKKNLADQKNLGGRIHLNESVTRMEDLFKKAEYEKVVQACEEILRLEPGNLTAKIFHKKAKNIIHAEIENGTVKKLKEAWAAGEQEYAKNPAAFVRI